MIRTLRIGSPPSLFKRRGLGDEFLPRVDAEDRQRAPGISD